MKALGSLAQRAHAPHALLVLVVLPACKKSPVPASKADDPPAVTAVAPPPTAPPVMAPAEPSVDPNAPHTKITLDSPNDISKDGGKNLPSLVEKAHEAAKDGRSKDVRAILEPKVRSGHGTPEEVRLLKNACKSPLDKACLDDLKAKYPGQ